MLGDGFRAAWEATAPSREALAALLDDVVAGLSLPALPPS